MPDHSHIITDGSRKPSDTLRFLNGISARRIIDYLKENDFSSSLEKLRQAKKKNGYQYSVWQHHPDKNLLTSESFFMQKVNYIHNNPVKDGLVERPEDYLFSSARIWKRTPLENEPLTMDVDKIGGGDDKLEAQPPVQYLRFCRKGEAFPLIWRRSRELNR